MFSPERAILNIYDAVGTKLQKITVDNIANKGTFTTYVAGFVYQRTTTPHWRRSPDLCLWVTYR
ncbi:MAG TPA: hypothetical protein VIJ92_00440 [Ginsengibacter sp.]